MVNRISSLILFIFLLSNRSIAQSDTNFLYLDFLELSIEDSTENLLSFKFENATDTLSFSNVLACKMIGISRKSECRLIVTTNKSVVILENINEYLSFPEAKHFISIILPTNHSSCVEATYFNPDGAILLHSQTMRQLQSRDCIMVEAGPSGYADFKKFETNYVLD